MSILSNRENRLIPLLKHLNQNTYSSLEDMSKAFDCSKSTIINDLNFLKDSWGNLITITIQKDNIIKLDRLSNGNINKIISQIIINSLEIQFIKILFLAPNKNIYYYSQQLYTSTATIYRIIKKLNIDLKPYGIKIHSKHKTYHLTSTSQDKMDLFLFFAKGLEEFYGQEIPMVSNKNELELFNTLYDFYLPEEQYFMYLIWGTISRNNSINHIKMIEFDDFIDNYNNIPIPEQIDNSIYTFISEVNKTFNTMPDIYLTLKNILIFCIKREKLFNYNTIFINRHLLFVENLARSSEPIFSEIKKHLKTLLEKLNMNVEFSLNHVIYLLVINSRITLKEKDFKRILVYSDLGSNHATFVKNSILNVLTKEEFEIEVIELDFFKDYIQQENDIIISTKFISSKLNTIFVDDYLNESNYISIKHALRII